MSITLDIVLAAILLGFSALFSGLTLGLLSLNPSDLRRKMELGDTDAVKVYPIRQRGNELLVTLILGNVLVNAALTVVLNSFINGLLAILLSTVLITSFGEILPQAMLKKHGLRFGARIAPLIDRTLGWMRWLTGPIGKFLDRTIGGEHPTVYSKEELLKIMDEHEGDDSDIEDEDLSIAKHALSFADKLIRDVMLPRKEMIVLKETDILSPVLLNQLHESPDSAFPVFRSTKDNMVGTLYLRDLVGLSLKQTKVEDVMDKDVFYVRGNQKLDHALSAFLRTKHHLFVVIDEKEKTLGVVTIEDIIDEVLGRKHLDKFNQHDDRKAVASIKGEVE